MLRRIGKELLTVIMGLCLVAFVIVAIVFFHKEQGKDAELLDQIATGDFHLKDTWTEHNGWGMKV